MDEREDVVQQLHVLANYAESANHWTDDKRLMAAAGVADTIYGAIDRIEKLEEQQHSRRKRMDEREELVWKYLVSVGGVANAEMVVENCGVERDYAQRIIDRIGTPREVLEAARAPLREIILDTAKRYVSVDRAADHGEAEDNFSNIAGHWTWWLQGRLKEGETLTAYDVSQMMVGFKQARMKYNHKHVDSAIDLCGYGAIAGEIGDRA